MHGSLFSRRGPIAAAVLTSLGLALSSGSAAQAATVATTTSSTTTAATTPASSSCAPSTVSQPFAAWSDVNDYELVPGGSFESGTKGWTLGGGAKVVAGSEPFGVTGSVGKYSLSLPAGASAQSPLSCVDASYPSLRLFARNDGALANLSVEVVYPNVLGALVAINVGNVAMTTNWAPTNAMSTLAAIPSALAGGSTQVALRFTETGGTSQIDDVYIDPRMRR